MIRRWLMRRAYNLGQWEVAKQQARLLLTKPKEMELARSVYIRSCWHLNSFEEVVELTGREAESTSLDEVFEFFDAHLFALFVADSIEKTLQEHVVLLLVCVLTL